MDEHKTVVEINGIKLEVDMRYARRIEEYRVGDNVKLLIKSGYGSGFESYPGVIVGFDPFPSRPTIVVAYIKIDYSSAEMKFAYINEENKDVEICHMAEAEVIIDKVSAVEKIDREIAKKEKELEELQYKKNYFLTNFGAYLKAFEKVDSTD